LTGTQMALPAGTPRSTLLPARVRDLLATCFGVGHSAPDQRPTADMWSAALRDVRASLATCTYHGSHAYPRELSGCPWCEIIAAAGPDRFAGPEPALGATGRSPGAAWAGQRDRPGGSPAACARPGHPRRGGGAWRPAAR